MSRIVITGASRGIGLELCKYFARQGHEVYAACRVISAALYQLSDSGVIAIEGVDVFRDDGIVNLRSALAGKSIDILVNNAGVLKSDKLGDLAYADIDYQFQVNAVGPLRVTEALTENLKTGSKVAMITSRMGSITDNSSGGYYGYRMSKAALNAAGVNLARDLGSRGIAVALLHPGFVQTDMVGFAGDITPAVAAERLAARIDELTLESSGSFWHANGERLPW